jgi:hypothetical protein
MQAQATAADQDDIYEEAVFRHVLTEHPTIFRLNDLIRELAKDPDEFGHRDSVERAVRDQVKAGVLHRQCECILPTPAALYIWRLVG